MAFGYVLDQASNSSCTSTVGVMTVMGVYVSLQIRKFQKMNPQTRPQQDQANQPTAQPQDDNHRPADDDLFVWNADAPARVNYDALGKRLASNGGYFRRPEPEGGLLRLVPPMQSTRLITTGKQLLPSLYDTLNVVVAKKGEFTGSTIPQRHLDAMLQANCFLRHFHVVSQVSSLPRYLPGFQLTRPGYNPIARNDAIFFTGDEPTISRTTDAINRFLDVMAFETEADRTNAVAAAITSTLRNHWPGGKPIFLVTASKSHAGKDTVIDFATGLEKKVSISYQGTDWALERSFVGAVNSCPELGVLVVENARLYGRTTLIASGFIERFATDPRPMLFSTSTGAPVHMTNDIVLAISTNFGDVSEDILNRCLPVHMTPNGNVQDRQSPIGNPKHEYLPANRDQISAEIRGLIENWKEQGSPIDTNARHPFSLWAQTIGGILLANGFQSFLANYGARKVSSDPVRESLGYLGASSYNQWLRTKEWVFHTEQLGLIGKLIPSSDRESAESMCRGLGVVLSAHENETVVAELEDGFLTMKIEKTRRRFDAGQQPHTRYCFSVLNWQPFPEDL